jgi:hypothetical protein
MANEMIPNLDAKFYVLPYKVTTDIPSEDKSQLFSMTGVRTDGTYIKDEPVDLWAGQLTK